MSQVHLPGLKIFTEDPSGFVLKEIATGLSLQSMESPEKTTSEDPLPYPGYPIPYSVFLLCRE